MLDKEGGESRCSLDRLLLLDRFGTEIVLRHKNKQTKYRTSCGACMTLLTLTISLVYFSSLLIIMTQGKLDRLNTSIIDNYYDAKGRVTSQDGFRIAVGVIDQLSFANSVEDISAEEFAERL